MVLLSVLKLLGIALNTVLLAPVVRAVSALGGRWGYRVVAALGADESPAHGRAHPYPAPGRRSIRTRPYVFMSNHQSHFDVLAVVAALPEFQLRWVAKKELTTRPGLRLGAAPLRPHHHRPQQPRAGDGEPARREREDAAAGSR